MKVKRIEVVNNVNHVEMITEFNNLNGCTGITITGIKDKNVESIIIPERINGYPVTAICSSDEWLLPRLKYITIPKSVIEIESLIFYGSNNINVINGEFIEYDFIIINDRFIYDNYYVYLIAYQVGGDYVVDSDELVSYFVDKVWHGKYFFL